MASDLHTAAARNAFARGDSVGYYAGSAGEDLRAMLLAQEELLNFFLNAS